MKSGKQRRHEIRSKQASRKQKTLADERLKTLLKIEQGLRGKILVNPGLLAPSGSYDTPAFVKRGYYVDMPFTCKDCGKEEIWTATQQRWWYEIAHGDVWTTAIRCRFCRRIERARVAEARRVYREGLEKKNSGQRKTAIKTVQPSDRPAKQKLHEEAFVHAFIVKAKQSRYLLKLASFRHRRVFLSRLHHNLDYAPHLARRIPTGEQTIGQIITFLRRLGAPETCHVIAAEGDLDGRELALDKAIDEGYIAGSGIVLSCIPGRLAYYRSEDTNGHYLLQKQ